MRGGIRSFVHDRREVQRTLPERARLASLKVALPGVHPGKRAMPATEPTAAGSARQDPYRWSRPEIATALDTFSDTDPPSQREAAQRLGIPHATFNYWMRHYGPADACPVDPFFRSAAGELALRRIVAAALVAFHLRGACGIRPVGEFLHH